MSNWFVTYLPHTQQSDSSHTHFWPLCCVQDEFSHPVESLALTVDEVINVRRVLVKAEMEKYLQSKELYNNLKKGKVMRSVSVFLPLSVILVGISIF